MANMETTATNAANTIVLSFIEAPLSENNASLMSPATGADVQKNWLEFLIGPLPLIDCAEGRQREWKSGNPEGDGEMRTTPLRLVFGKRESK
jgi:hypothetical protein